MQTSLELLVIELGVSLQPFQESYRRYSEFVTSSWLKSIWEKVDMFDIDIDILNIPLEFPREGDKWLMQLFREAGFSKAQLLRLNRVRIFQQVLFLSDVLGAGGKSLDRKYLRKRKSNER